jgi:hypothetical protein
MLVIEGGSTRSLCGEYWLWERLWTGHKTDCRTEEYKQLRKSVDLGEVE